MYVMYYMYKDIHDTIKLIKADKSFRTHRLNLKLGTYNIPSKDVLRLKSIDFIFICPYWKEKICDIFLFSLVQIKCG